MKALSEMSEPEIQVRIMRAKEDIKRYKKELQRRKQ